MKKIVVSLLFVLMLSVTMTACAELWTPDTDAASTLYGWVTTAPTADDAHHITIGVTLAGETEEKQFCNREQTWLSF